MKNIAIIPARSGSKGLPDKNIKELCGKPLLSYSIEAANNTGLFEEVMVSTDSEYYADIARACGASVPFLRSEKNSSDHASSWDMVREVLAQYRNRNMDFDTVCLLQPTSPLRTAEDINGAYKLYKEKKANTVVSVCEAEHSPKWCNILDNSLSMCEFIRTDAQEARQKLERYYRINGAIYIVDVDKLEENKVLYDEDSYAYIMSQEKSIDIDTKLDFVMAQVIMEHGMILE